MTLNVKDLHWLAGWVEGEGSFSTSQKHHHFAMRVGVTDEDVARRAANIVGVPVKRAEIIKSGKQVWRVEAYGSLAIQWAMTLYAFMGDRRKRAIRHMLQVWRERSSRPNSVYTRFAKQRVRLSTSI